MASLIHYTAPRHGWQLQCYAVGDSRKRHSVWLGDMPESNARRVKLHIEAVIESIKLGVPMAGETRRWLETLPAHMRHKLAPILGAARYVSAATEAFLEWSGNERAASTTEAKRNTLDAFAKQFGGRQLRSLTPREVDTWLDTLNLAPSTVAKSANHLTSFFAWATDMGWMDPIKLQTVKTIGRGHKHFIPTDDLQRLIDYFAADPQMHCAIAYARWYGARIPSELVTLVRGSIDLEASRIRIQDQKRTKRTNRNGTIFRDAPLFPQWQPYLEAIWHLSTHPNDPLLPDVQSGPAFIAAVRNARQRMNLDWPRLFTSIRATRETELINQYGIAAACLWIGNSPETARRHYELIPDDVWEAACRNRQSVGVPASAGDLHNV